MYGNEPIYGGGKKDFYVQLFFFVDSKLSQWNVYG